MTKILQPFITELLMSGPFKVMALIKTKQKYYNLEICAFKKPEKISQCHVTRVPNLLYQAEE